MASATSILLAQIAAYNRAHPGAVLDPAAELAVARQEGLSGGIGDGGHAFGPYQLNNAGGVITGMFPGQSAAQINAWAWSPAGLQYALSRIGRVAGGLSGAAAVRNIVSRFERPANVSRETANALAALGLPVPAGGTVPVAGGAAPQAVVAAGSSGQAQALTALRSLLAASSTKVPVVNANFLPITLPTPVAPAPVAAFTSPLLTADYGGPLGSLAT
jgi:hypothetical protein